MVGGGFRIDMVVSVFRRIKKDRIFTCRESRCFSPRSDPFFPLKCSFRWCRRSSKKMMTRMVTLISSALQR